jgi:hypothetical protein
MRICSGTLRRVGSRSAKLREVYDAVRAIRREQRDAGWWQGDADARSAGSFFKNPVVDAEMVARLAGGGMWVDEVPRFPGGADGMVKVPAAWLMERAGFCKGFAMGRAGLSSKHVLAIVNRGGATAAEIVALRDAVVGEVQARFGITLEQEPVMLGFLGGVSWARRRVRSSARTVAAGPCATMRPSESLMTSALSWKASAMSWVTERIGVLCCCCQARRFAMRSSRRLRSRPVKGSSRSKSPQPRGAIARASVARLASPPERSAGRLSAMCAMRKSESRLASAERAP